MTFKENNHFSIYYRIKLDWSKKVKSVQKCCCYCCRRRLHRFSRESLNWLENTQGRGIVLGYILFRCPQPKNWSCIDKRPSLSGWTNELKRKVNTNIYILLYPAFIVLQRRIQQFKVLNKNKTRHCCRRPNWLFLLSFTLSFLNVRDSGTYYVKKYLHSKHPAFFFVPRDATYHRYKPVYKLMADACSKKCC